jgi:hypothetical protein
MRCPICGSKECCGGEITEKVDRQLNAYKTLVDSLENRISSHRGRQKQYEEAVTTLASERECNAILTKALGTESPTTKLTVNAGELPAGIFSSAGITPHTFVTFGKQDNQEIMRLDKDGMVFMGERITDAGEAYAAWMKTMAMMQGK